MGMSFGNVQLGKLISMLIFMQYMIFLAETHFKKREGGFRHGQNGSHNVRFINAMIFVFRTFVEKHPLRWENASEV